MEHICRCCNKHVVSPGESCPACDWVDDPDTCSLDDFSEVNGASAREAAFEYFEGE